MDFYIYATDIWCEDCGEKIMEELEAAGKAPEDPIDENTYDSDDFPKGPNGGGVDEADSPQHCAAGEKCLNAEEWGNKGKVGCFLENKLTYDGHDHLCEMIVESLNNGRIDIVKEWALFYDIELSDLFDWAQASKQKGRR